ncbi:electron transfer flavoprotein subunit beta/FixA family protein [Dubosiella newyorkensis]|uniref:Electron transfer flavoprotein small subunit n=1 Tax=Dubosiella newyorkensis TaxID=1862672 RepID=A0A1U7NME3_9FIRM|nr:electron transfer flavoprotein subunit beta/FixA family protein [Dubosiella newyorkensis]OLU46367.1 electron transfer flavoprotein subunit beta [Dubosiella newyorkensis]
MNILVCIKQVPESNKVEVDPVTGVIKRDGAASKMNPYDLYALETAFRIQEKMGGVVDVISMGPPQAQEVIREAFAMGADHGILVSDRSFGGADVLATSYTLSQGIKSSGNYDLILCGKQTIDGDTAQVGAEIAEWLQIPSVNNVLEIKEVHDDSITISMDLPQEVEVAKISLPCLLSVDQDIFMPRLPSYVKKKATKDREIKVLSLKDMEDTDASHYGLNGSPTQVQRIFPPTSSKEKEMWDGSSAVLADQLFHKIEELKFV